MEIGKTLQVETSKEWREWLDKNHNKEKDVWLVFFKKASGKQTISLNEAVDEALCFGWIDNIEKGVDEEKFALRFSPRKPNSNWSKRNIEKVKMLIAEGKMTKSGLEQFNKRQ